MKRSIHRSLAVVTLVASLGLNAFAEAPGLVDFGKFAEPAEGAEYVEVQIKSNLISLAAQLVEKQEPDVAKLIRSVEMIRVNVIGLTDENRDELKSRIAKVRADLDAKGWDKNVNVRGKNGEDVAVFTKTRGGDALSGLAITVMDKEHLVLANIVGDIKPSQIAELGEKMNIEPLKQVGKTIKEEAK